MLVIESEQFGKSEECKEHLKSKICSIFSLMARNQSKISKTFLFYANLVEHIQLLFVVVKTLVF